jgi:hypothetical protein
VFSRVPRLPRQDFLFRLVLLTNEGVRCDLGHGLAQSSQSQDRLCHLDRSYSRSRLGDILYASSYFWSS